MITLPSEADQRRVLEALAEPEEMNARPVLKIGVSEEDYGLRFLEGDWGQNAIAIGMQGRIGRRLPRRFENAKTRLYAEVDGVSIPQLVGQKSAFTFDEATASTTLATAASGGSLLPEVKLRRFKEYPPQAPEGIIRDALYRVADVGGYDRALISVDALGAPLLSFQGGEGFKPEESASDILSRVLEQITSYVVRDDVFGGTRARIAGGIGAAEDVTRTFRASDFPNWTPPQRTTPQYDSVEVYREKPDGTDAYRQVAQVTYYGVDRAPFANTTWQIPLNDDSAAGPANAQRIANDQALALGRGLYGAQGLYLPHFYPLVECLDLFMVYEDWRDDDGLWDRAWLLRVDAYRHARSRAGTTTTASRGSAPGGLSTQVAHTAALLEEELVRVPDLIVPGPSPGVLVTPTAPYGLGPGEFWVNPDVQDPVFLNADGVDGLWVDESFSSGGAGFNATEGLWVIL